MSKLHDLINKLCPMSDGRQAECVEITTLGSLMKRVRERGKYDSSVSQVYVVSSEFGMVNAEDYREHTIHSEDTSNYTIVKPKMFAYNPARLNIGSIAMLKKDRPGLVSPMYVVFEVDNSKVINEYFEYVVKSSYVLSKINAFTEEGARFRFDYARWNWIKIPLPPIEIQREIVKILDTFTELIKNLSLELELRKKQYAYYRDKLLTFGEDVPRVSIKDLYTRLKGTPITAAKMKAIANSEGSIKIFAGGKTVVNAFEDDIPNANIINVPAVIVQSRGVIDFIFYEKYFTFKNEMWAYTCNEKVSVKFLYYVLKNNVEYFRKIASIMGSLPQISLPVTENYEIPLPPLDVQEKIVKILDEFEAYCNNLSDELKARRKQYEFYREKLLNFNDE